MGFVFIVFFLIVLGFGFFNVGVINFNLNSEVLILWFLDDVFGVLGFFDEEGFKEEDDFLDCVFVIYEDL